MTFVEPSPTGALLVTLRPRKGAACLVIGSNRQAASRVLAAIEAGYKVYVAHDPTKRTEDFLDAELKYRVETAQAHAHAFDEHDIGKSLTSIENLDLVCVTDSVLSAKAERRTAESCEHIATICRQHRIHVNFVDQTHLIDLSFPATHRWRTADGSRAHALQVAVNTFGKGCRLATRIRREIVAHLPADVGRAVDNIAAIRQRIIDMTDDARAAAEHDEDDQLISEPINTPVKQYGSPVAVAGSYFPDVAESVDETQSRRMKWMAQVSEYWPIKTIGRLRPTDIDRLLTDFDTGTTTPAMPSLATSPAVSRSPSTSNLSKGIAMQSLTAVVAPSEPPTVHALDLHAPTEQTNSNPRVLLLGSGPGHPSLLTVAALQALRTADLVLADKLVPAPVLALIPKNSRTTIAKKFPGNAENAQVELQELALQFLQERSREGRGGTVVRLKQGDPYVYGRGGEEVLFFRKHGYEAIVVPGVSSALAAPLFAQIPVTQRGVADQMVLCTGVGRLGKTSLMPGYRRATTLVVLMGVARIGELVAALTSKRTIEGQVSTTRDGAPYPEYLPVSIIERGSSRDQRCITTTIARAEQVIDHLGDQRPPGMLVIGWVNLALLGEGNVDVTEPSGLAAGDEGDKARVSRALGSQGYIVAEGIRDDWQGFLDDMDTLARQQ
ncbi:uroporphyrin-III C-methyltransferase [Savitreella phatthalungensis]